MELLLAVDLDRSFRQHVPPVPESEQTPAAEVPLTRKEKENLLQKMYSLPHWIAVVRLFGYQAMHMDDARRKIKPLADEYGKEPVANACEVLVEIFTEGKEPFARLKSHVRRMAFQILGPEKQEPVAPTAADVGTPSSAAATTPKPRAKLKPGPEARPVKQPRHYVLKQCEQWLNDTKLSFVAIDDVKRITPAVAPHVGSLDFIVLRGNEKLFVTVRPNLQAKHLASIGELQELFGADYRPVRVWPTDGPDGWTWQEYPVDDSVTQE